MGRRPAVPARPAGSNLVRVSGHLEQWPADLLDGPEPAWLVVRSLPRQEKVLARDLRELGVPGCLFLERRLRRYPGKGLQESLVPLLSSYVFVAAGLERRPAIYRTRRVHSIMPVQRPGELWRELCALRRILDCAGTPLMVRPEIITGDCVRITEGVFTGCSGVVVRRRRRSDLVVNLEILGHSVWAELPACTAEKTG
jgi:transcription antitermination factor NusG